MATKNYLSLERLKEYDALIKAKIAADDVAALKSAKDYTDAEIAKVVAGDVAHAALADAANKLSAERTIALSGDATGSVAFDGSKDVTIEVTVADDSHNHDGRYYTESEIDELLNGKSDDDHNHDNTYYAKNLGEQVASGLSTLEGVVATKADQTALNAVSAVANAAVKQSDYDTKVAALEAEDTRIAGLVSAETKRATDVEADFEDRISEMETFWEAADNPEGTIDKLAEIVNYIAADKSGALDMAGDIEANTKAIADMDAAYKAADAGLQSAIDGLNSGKVDKVTGKSLILDTEIARLAGMSDGANKVEASTNGHIKIDGVDTVVYTHPDKHTSGDISDFATAVAAVKVNNAFNADAATKATQDGNGKVIADTYAVKATTLEGYGITDAYTTSGADTAISNAITTYDSTWEEVKDTDITALFNQ